ncbi:MAG: CTP synthase [Candidatus ainarchaeum sp.]|nr:CTP synthase [Candidatus ainarchaeum sp.]
MARTKFIVVMGSIMSGLGKGILSSSIARLLKKRGYKVLPIKFDGYLNVDCGTMNPFRHGEVFVLDDGSEVDMDFGTYERFLNQSLTGKSSITGGKLFKRIIEKERRGDFLGRDVQFVPHLTDEIKCWVKCVAEEEKADIVLIEVGGTVGDLENGYFIEAMRQLGYGLGKDLLFIQLTFVPTLGKGELKTKPTQHANRLIQSMGVRPEIVICRGDEPLTKESREKISLYCNVPMENVLDDPFVQTVYQLPEMLEKQNLYEVLANRLELRKGAVEESNWERLVGRILKPTVELRVGVVGKYTSVSDAYVSIKEALVHSGAVVGAHVRMDFVESTDIEEKGAKELEKYDAVIVPGGFGKRGTEGKIKAIQHCRENGVPYLGLCLGMQLMVVEYARNVCGLKGANSTEMEKETPHPVIDILPEQVSIIEKGATMRLGAYPCILKEGTKAFELYGGKNISERHRHRYEVNPNYAAKLGEGGLVISGVSPKNSIVEMCEWKGGFGIGTQAHPELKSRLEAPAPLFIGLLKAALKRKKRD